MHLILQMAEMIGIANSHRLFDTTIARYTPFFPGVPPMTLLIQAHLRMNTTVGGTPDNVRALLEVVAKPGKDQNNSLFDVSNWVLHTYSSKAHLRTS